MTSKVPQNKKIVTISRTQNLNIQLANPVTGVVNFACDTNTGVGFKLNSIPGYSELTSLFDQYRIKSIRVTWRPQFNTAPMTANADALCPTLITVPDYNDATLLTTRAQYLQYEGVRSELLDHPITRTFWPRPSMAVYNNMITTGYAAPDTAPWIDTTSPGAEHYAVKWALAYPIAGTSVANGHLMLEVNYTLELRGVN